MFEWDIEPDPRYKGEPRFRVVHLTPGLGRFHTRGRRRAGRVKFGAAFSMTVLRPSGATCSGTSSGCVMLFCEFALHE